MRPVVPHCPPGRPLPVILVSLLDQVGRIAKQPPFWMAVAGALRMSGQAQARRAAARAGLGYAVTAVIANLVLKPLAHRRRPLGASGPGPLPPLTSSMPSGHAASDTAFAVAASLVMPSLRWPMLALTTASHWSLVRARSHHVTDIVVGDVVGSVIGVCVNRRWPSPPAPDPGAADPGAADPGAADPGAADPGAAATNCSEVAAVPSA
ncbi:MAG: phosphatase PAP2 family protein [Acidimicrobiales bacterium]